MAIRKRMVRRDEPNGVRFVTASCYRRLALFNNDRIKDVFVSALAQTREQHRFELFAWVLMPEHFHLLLRPMRGEGEVALPKLTPILVTLKQGVSQRVLHRWKELNAPVLTRITTPSGGARFWQPGGGFDRNVRSPEEFSREVAYIHRNPVERGLVARPEHWPWSSVHWWLGQRDGPVNCDPPPGSARIAWEQWRGFM